ncbi:ABC transporter permease [Candidatus Nanosalina sp. VS9-1]|uniref:ABC transporter permease n=1 Tax=Candidatus Nanosalina sp. VS9-1 TaxID=3388566 RepID=UPI0039E0B6D6
MFLDFLKLAVRNIRHRKRRSWLTILGTMIGILAIVSLISIGQGLENSVQQEVQDIGGNKVFISPGGGSFQRFTGTADTLSEEDLSVIRNTRGVEKAASVITGSVIADYQGEKEYMTIRSGPLEGNEELIQEVDALNVEEGRFMRPADTTNIVLEENTAQDTFEEELGVGSRIEIENEKFRVVGIVSRGLSTGGGLYMNIDQARKLLNRSEGYDSIVAEAQDGVEPSDLEDRIRRNLRQSRNLDEGEEDFSTRTAEDIIRSFNNQLAIIRGVLVGIGGISLLVGAVGIMNTMYTSVVQRTREIGVMKAIGATRKQIMLIFMIESGIIGAVGGLIGAILGVGLSSLAAEYVSRSMGLAFSASVSSELLIGSVFFAFVVGMISGVLPARKAARLKPAEALSY